MRDRDVKRVAGVGLFIFAVEKTKKVGATSCDCTQTQRIENKVHTSVDKTCYCEFTMVVER